MIDADTLVICRIPDGVNEAVSLGLLCKSADVLSAIHWYPVSKYWTLIPIRTGFRPAKAMVISTDHSFILARQPPHDELE